MGLRQWISAKLAWGRRSLPAAVAGEIVRIGYAQALAQSRGHYVVTFAGDPKIHRLLPEIFEHAETLALAMAGDWLEFVAEPAGHGLEEALIVISIASKAAGSAEPASAHDAPADDCAQAPQVESTHLGHLPEIDKVSK